MWPFDKLRKQVDKVSSNNTEGLANMFYNYRTELAYNLYNIDYKGLNNLKIPRAIVNTIVTSASQEFDFDIKTNSKDIKQIEKYLKSNLKMAESHLCVGGRLAFKPYISDGHIGVSIYGGRDFIAFYDQFGLLEKVYFKSDIRESNTLSYTLVEIHTYNRKDRTYKIEYQLYSGVNSDWNRKIGTMSAQLGTRVPLSKCEKTQDLDDFVLLEDIDEHLCSVINLDNSMTYTTGRSIYDSSIELIKDAEKIYDSLLWEYEGGELAIDAPADLFKTPGNYNGYTLPANKERLYRRLEGADSDFGIKVFAPTLRDENYIRGLNEILHRIEVNCGLYGGALSNVAHDYTDKTATEVISSKQRFYVTVMDIKQRMKNGIEKIINSCALLNNRLVPELLKDDVTVDFEIGDSVLELDIREINI